MHWILALANFILHIDTHLAQIVQEYGDLAYGLIGSIVFIETGFVIAPFLPGDSLIFTAGAFAARGIFQLPILIVLFICAAVLGDTVNYTIGHWCRDWLDEGRYNRWVKREHLLRAQTFYRKHGAKMIVLARFIPILRTFAPFVAGMSNMRFRTFFGYNLLGGALWVMTFLTAGYLFGNVSIVRERFSILIIGIVALSSLPLLFEALEQRRADKRARV